MLGLLQRLTEKPHHVHRPPNRLRRSPENYTATCLPGLHFTGGRLGKSTLIQELFTQCRMCLISYARCIHRLNLERFKRMSPESLAS